MAIFITGDTHGDFSRLLPAAFHEQRNLTKEDYRYELFGHYHDNYMINAKHILLWK